MMIDKDSHDNFIDVTTDGKFVTCPETQLELNDLDIYSNPQFKNLGELFQNLCQLKTAASHSLCNTTDLEIPHQKRRRHS